MNASTGALVRVIQGATYGFIDPDALVVSGPDLYVANGAGESVTEINRSTAGLVQVFSNSSYPLADPVALAVSGSGLYVASPRLPSMTELPIGCHADRMFARGSGFPS